VLRNTAVMKCRTQVIFKTAATVQTFVLTSDTQCTVCRGHNFTGTVHIFFSVRVTIYWECTQFFFCQGHNLLGLYTVFFLSGSQFYWDCTQFFPVRVTIYWDCTQFFSVRVTIYWDCTQIFSCQGHNFTGTVHSFFMSGSQFYWDCTQFFFCQGHNLLGLYTFFFCQGHNLLGLYTFFFCQGHNLLGLYTVFFLSGSQFTGTVHSFFSVRVTIYWDCTQCTVSQTVHCVQTNSDILLHTHSNSKWIKNGVCTKCLPCYLHHSERKQGPRGRMIRNLSS